MKFYQGRVHSINNVKKSKKFLKGYFFLKKTQNLDKENSYFFFYY